MDHPVPFGIWLKQRRRALRLTQQELAARAGCALTTLKKIEAGARRPSARLAAHLAEHLQLSATRDLFLQVAQGKLDTAVLPGPAEFLEAAPRADPRPQRHHLPVVLTPLIGRAREVAAIWAALERDGVRLLTLTGPPGVGKTRLSLQVAADLCDSYPDGVVFVALGAISDPALVTPAIADALGVREAAGEPHAAGLLDRLHAALHGQHLLLVLDNFEQVAEAAPVVGALLAAPRVQILVTSRVPLHLSGEYTYPVSPLALPDRGADNSSAAEIEQLQEVESVRLFVERARMVNPDFALSPENAHAVAAICRHLDGLPLAIELAAARSRLLAPQALEQRLHHALGLLHTAARDVPARQESLHSAIAWSYQLLTPAEQTLFARLGVFAGGCTVEAAEVVCGDEAPGDGHGTGGDPDADGHVPTAADVPAPRDFRPWPVLDGLQSLLDKSLLQQRTGVDGEPRLTMLETIHAYARERLVEGAASSGDLELVERRHAAYYLTLAEDAAHKLQTMEQWRWLQRLQLEHDNLRAALRWSQGSADMALRLVAALWRFWFLGGYFEEWDRWLASALAHDPGGMEVRRQAGLEKSAARASASRPASARGRAGACSSALPCGASAHPLARAQALFGRGFLAWHMTDWERAGALGRESLALYQAAGDRWGMAAARVLTAGTDIRHGNLARARACLAESVGMARVVGDAWLIAWTLRELGRIPHEQGDLRAAMACYEESLGYARSVGDPWLIAGALHFMGWAALAAHEHAQARARFEESLAIREAAGDQLGRAQSLEGLAALAMDQADYTAARALTEQRLATEQGLGNRLGIAASLRTLGWIAAAEGNGTEAAVRLEASLAHYQHAGNTLGQKFTLADLRRLALARGDDAAAQAFEHAQAALQRAEGARQDQPPTGLTSREAEVLRLVALGLTNAEVAERLIVSPFTVNAHLRAIFGKLGVTSRSAATRFAIDHHLI